MSASTEWKRFHQSNHWWQRQDDRTSVVQWLLWDSCASPCVVFHIQSKLAWECWWLWSSQLHLDPKSSGHGALGKPHKADIDSEISVRYDRNSNFIRNKTQQALYMQRKMSLGTWTSLRFHGGWLTIPASSTWWATAAWSSTYVLPSSWILGNRSLIRLRKRGSSSSTWNKHTDLHTH